ncbi:hypothetical protein PFISCL1PPCAC_6643, partial [Pristionchus fissidentatus]
LKSFLLILLSTQIAIIQATVDPFDVEWKNCEEHSCFVPGTCDGSIESQLKIVRYPKNCSTGVIVQIINKQKWSVSIIVPVHSGKVTFDWKDESMMTCDQSDTAVPNFNFGPHLSIKPSPRDTSSVRIKCTYELTLLVKSWHDWKDDIKKMFEGSNTTTTFLLRIADPLDVSKETVYKGFTETIREEIEFRLPSSHVMNWTLCETQVCFVAGECAEGTDNQLKLYSKPKPDCANGLILNIINNHEWQITMSGRTKDTKDIEFIWNGRVIFGCSPHFYEQHTHEVLTGYKAISHIPIQQYADDKRTNKCTFTFLAEPNEMMLHKTLFGRIRPNSKAMMELRITDKPGGDNAPKTNFKGYIEDVRRDADFQKLTRKCVGCMPCVAPNCKLGKGVIPSATECEIYSCSDPEAKMNVNNRFFIDTILLCEDNAWKLLTSSTRKREIDNLESVECSKEFDCLIVTPLKSKCRKADDWCKPLMDMSLSQFTNNLCGNGFSLVHTLNKKSQRLESVNCDKYVY